MNRRFPRQSFDTGLDQELRKTAFRTAFAAATALTALTASAAFARTVYECTLEKRAGNHGWLPAIVVVAIDPGSETVIVADPMIEYVHGGPIDVVPKTNTEKRLSLKWKLTLPAADKDEVTVTYDFTILKAGNTAKISGLPHGYDNWMSTDGTCKVKKG